MKRLYVSPKARGLGLGMALIDAIIGEAVRIGYNEMRLDTAPMVNNTDIDTHRAVEAARKRLKETPNRPGMQAKGFDSSLG